MLCIFIFIIFFAVPFFHFFSFFYYYSLCIWNVKSMNYEFLVWFRFFFCFFVMRLQLRVTWLTFIQSIICCSVWLVDIIIHKKNIYHFLITIFTHTQHTHLSWFAFYEYYFVKINQKSSKKQIFWFPMNWNETFEEELNNKKILLLLLLFVRDEYKQSCFKRFIVKSIYSVIYIYIFFFLVYLNEWFMWFETKTP